ncbi:SDR family NAD(P)-dependent oxidoreductase [Rhodobaculum claviforme]|uniref:Short-chain dehydrogenase n=1 Tax=Rhodobaculum claviforme TaxID=1549854 RepID=A0A934TIE6_9RHOB|nr:SDR family NAD(P)-dependent oxidoreductase [Rhodobaculum claviforme]MBK5926392.1 short-chain dehydrogenase [Rhodobaculum claviforme]
MAEQDFAEKTAIVTGAASGIGAAIAAELAARGATVIASDMDADGLDRVVAQIAAAGGTAHARVADVSQAPAMEALVKFAEDKGGALHLAVNNAGIGGPSVPCGDYPPEGWRQVLSVNLDGVFYGMRYQIPAMKAAGGGSIVNVSSILGSVGFQGASAYVAAKHGVNGLTKVAAMEHAPDRIRVNAVGPAFIDTPLLSRNLSREVMDGLAALHPAGRLGTSEEVSGLVCFLLSDRASFITGSYHLVDGGYTAQ